MKEHKGSGELVLSRKVGEVIEIGDNIFVTVKSVKGKVVKVSVWAPAHVKVLRSELAAGEESA